jgi:hypothetical protein
MNVVGRVALAVVGLTIGLVAVLALRSATMSSHEPVPSNSRIELIVSAHSSHAEPRQTLGELVEAQVQTCRLEVSSDIVGEIEHVGGDHFRAVLKPSMDENNRRQFRGCLEDWAIDNVRLHVVRLVEMT